MIVVAIFLPFFAGRMYATKPSKSDKSGTVFNFRLHVNVCACPFRTCSSAKIKHFDVALVH